MCAPIVATTGKPTPFTFEPSSTESASKSPATGFALSDAAASLTAPTTSTNLRIFHLCEHE